MYYEGDNYIYTSNSTYPIDTFFEEGFYFKEWKKEEFLESTETVEQIMVRAEEQVSVNGTGMEALTIMYPLRFRSGNAFILFVLDSIHLVPEDSQAGFIVNDAKENLVLYRLTEEIPTDLLKMYRLQENQMESIQKIDGFPYMLYCVKSDKTAWQYYKISTTEQIYGEYLRIQKIFYFLIIFIAIIGFIFIYFSMVINYNPLYKLKQFAENTWSNFNREGDADAIESIENALTQLVHENTELKVKTSDASRAHFIQQLLKGRITDKDEFLKQVEELKLIALNKSSFFVLIIAVKIDMQEKIDPKYMEEIINRWLFGYIKEHSEAGKYVFTGSLDIPDPLIFRHKILDIQDALSKELKRDVVLASSSICDSFDKISQCYLDAALAVDYRFIKGNNCVIDSSQLVLNEEIGAVYPQQMFDKLNYQIKSGDADKIQQNLNEIITYIKNSDLPLYYVKGLCYQLIHNISGIIEQLNRDVSSKRNKFSYATVLADYDTAEELIDAVRNISLNICAYIRNEKTETESKLLQDMKAYINQNVFDSSFSVQNMADSFQMTLPAVSSFFKYQCGITIIDYVTELRMNRAIKLLLEEQLTLNEIVTEVGYLNTSSFIRKFKSMYGLTPGQYVKHNKEQREENKE